MSCSLVSRCGLVWLAFMLFLLDGGKFLKAQDEQPVGDKEILTSATKENDDSANAKVDQEAKNDNEESGYSPPDWFDDENEFSDENRMVFVETDEPAQTKSHAESELKRKSVQKISKAVVSWLGLPNAEYLQLDSEYIFENLLFENRKVIKQDLDCKLLAEQLLAERGDSAGAEDLQFFCGYAQFQLDDDFRTYVEASIHETRTKKRLIRSGLIGGSLLAMLAVAFGYLKMETATRGFYSRRLQTVSLIVAAVLLAVFYWFGQQLV